ncbi:MAG TPA: ATP-binding protein, partial [Polyangiaceae bacterium]|nr:ATP-binding protein [Polyangiaceae bacterium]
RELYYRALLHSQKLEAVGSLAGGVAHDLSNLLQVIRFNVDSLRERADRDSYGRLEEIGQVTERAVGLVRQLLLFSRKQPMARRVLDLGDVVRDLVRLLRRVIPENVRTHVEIDEHLPPVRADVSAIEQLLMNLMLNARDAMPNGGSIHVSVSRTRRVPPERIRIKSSMEQVALLVRDAGPGMAEDVLGRIFDPFFTTKVHSSGLGLSVVHGVAEEHGGWVEVSSVVGQGSCFAVYLPVAEEPSSAQDEESLGQTVCAGRGERLMLVEDDDVVRRALARELSRYGYTVQAVACGEEALKIYRRAPGYFDCVISDGLMPGVSGPEMVLDMLKVNPAQRAIFMSGYAPTLECWKDLQSRGYRLLAKPFGVSELVAAIRQTLDGDDDVQAPTVRASHLGR